MAMAMELIKRGADIAIAELVARELPSRKTAGVPLRKRWEWEWEPEEEKVYSALPYYGDDEEEEKTFSALPYYGDDEDEKDFFSSLPFFQDDEEDETLSTVPCHGDGEEEKIYSTLPYYGDDEEEEKIYSALPYYGDDEEEKTYSTLPFYGEEEKTSSLPYYGVDRNFHTQSLGGPAVEPWQLTLMVGTAALGILFIVLLKYTVSLLLTLAAVEEPASVYLPVESEDRSDIEGMKTPAVRADGNPPKRYLTSSIRLTLRHLRSEAGFFSAWRGFSAHAALFAATFLIRTAVLEFFGRGLPEPLVRIIGSILVPISLARLSMVCTHIMISKPQKVMWFTRLCATPWSLARRTIPAIVICNVASQLVAESIIVTSRLSEDIWMMRALVLVNIYLVVFVVFPATVALIRVQASLLPDDQESIVNFDRTFGKTDGQIGITFAEAWRSVGKDGWRRIAKLFAKTYIPTFLLTIAVGAIAVLTWRLFSVL